MSIVKNNRPVFRTRGGISIGRSYLNSLHLTWPLAKLEIFPNKLVISYLFKKLEIRKKDIKDIKKYSGFTTEGLQLILFNSEKFIVFWLSSREETRTMMKRQGYKISEQ